MLVIISISDNCVSSKYILRSPYEWERTILSGNFFDISRVMWNPDSCLYQIRFEMTSFRKVWEEIYVTWKTFFALVYRVFLAWSVEQILVKREHLVKACQHLEHKH